MIATDVNLTNYETKFSLTQLTEHQISKNLATSFEREIEQGYVLESDLGFKFFEFLSIKLKHHFLSLK